MCAGVDWPNFLMAFHEMGHIRYFMNYRNQSYLFRAGANPGFQEAVADVVPLATGEPRAHIVHNMSISICQYVMEFYFLTHQAQVVINFTHGTCPFVRPSVWRNKNTLQSKNQPRHNDYMGPDGSLNSQDLLSSPIFL